MFISSCKNDSTEGLTFITHYPTLTLEGESFMVVEKGTTFYEPGYLAILQDEDVTNQVEVISEVNMNQSGLYSIFYKITNVEGFAKIASRQVLVVDFNDPIEGVYYTIADSYCDADGNIISTVDRSELFAAHTPQVFKKELYCKALNSLSNTTDVTDDNSLLERIGIMVKAVDTGAENVKITTVSDLDYARFLLKKKEVYYD
jgi:hypothetical protein